ncbi:glucosamine-6-phosphate deaminase [Candidatus Pacearchaeota archaeon]|nr:glucosamine-6-phosphate deaminase [Candidatus Pacearchaeota archaeon]
MEIIVLKNKKEVGEKAATIIIEAIKNKPSLVLGLASGSTVLPLYENLISGYNEGKINFSKVSTFNLDEYFLYEDDKISLSRFMEENLFKKINLKEEEIHFLDGEEENSLLACKSYEKSIKKHGGIDLQVLGIGWNGHIAFNEPGSTLNSRTRKVKLSETTIKDNIKFFHSSKFLPKYALTMGIGTILEAKKIILLATGKHKAKAVYNSIRKNPDKRTPASFLQRHKNVVFILDKDASEKL